MTSAEREPVDGLTIEAGSIFVFDAILVPGVDFERRLLGRRRGRSGTDVRFRSHPELSRAIADAGNSKIFGDCSGMRAFEADCDGRFVGVRLANHPDALITTGAPVVLTLEDPRLSRTVALVGLSVELHHATVDEVIALTQSAGASAKRSDKHAEPALSISIGGQSKCTLGEALAPFSKAIVELARRKGLIRPVLGLDRTITFESGRSWCCEIRRLDGAATAKDVLDDPELARPLYGLLHGDEGWRFVPQEHAHKEMRRTWGSRDYVALLARRSGVIVLNLEERRFQDRTAAVERSRALAGLTMPHLELGDVPVAGFDHGALFALERSLLRLLAARELEARLFRASTPMASAAGVKARIRRVLRGLVLAPALFRVIYRGPESRFYKDLLRVSGGSVSELAELDSFMEERLGAAGLLQRLSRAADLVDIELRDRRATTLNVVVVILTIAATAAAVLQLVFR